MPTHTAPHQMMNLLLRRFLRLPLLFSASIFINFSFAASYDCLIEPYQVLDISSAVTGVVEQVTVKRGDKVQQGQVLFNLESAAESAAAELSKFKSQATGALATALSKIDFSQKKYIRRRDMAEADLISKQDRDDAEAEWRLAEAELLNAKESKELAALEYKQQSSLLALRTVRSTINGVVVDQMVFPGETAEPGSKKPVLKLAQLDPLKIRVLLPMSTFGKAQIDTLVDVVPEHTPSLRLKAKVRQTDKVLDAASGFHVVFLELSNEQLQIPAGVKCRAFFHF